MTMTVLWLIVVAVMLVIERSYDHLVQYRSRGGSSCIGIFGTGVASDRVVCSRVRIGYAFSKTICYESNG